MGPYKRNSLTTAPVTNQIAEKLELTVDELMEAARRNTVAKFGVEFENAHRMGLCSLLRYPWRPEPFETVSMSESGLYVLSTGIRVNGAALILLPDVLEQIGERAGMDYFIIPSSIHELLIARDDGLVNAKIYRISQQQRLAEGSLSSDFCCVQRAGTDSRDLSGAASIKRRSSSETICY